MIDRVAARYLARVAFQQVTGSVTKSQVEAGWQKFVQIRDEADTIEKTTKEFKRVIALAAGKILRSLGAFTRYSSDGLTGRGLYWFGPDGNQLSNRPSDTTVEVLAHWRSRI